MAKFFGTTPDLWLNLQMRWDLFQAQREQQNDLARVMPYRPTPAPLTIQESGPTWDTETGAEN